MIEVFKPYPYQEPLFAAMKRARTHRYKTIYLKGTTRPIGYVCERCRNQIRDLFQCDRDCPSK